MGEVYRARDTRLERTVAIKVLASHASSDSDARARFEREARAIAALDHPHICAIYDTRSEGGVEYLVMQYPEGETLASRLQKGPLPLGLANRYGAEIADALDTAHRVGIVHRDLKPANVMLTKSGARLPDFGLARLQSAVAAISGLSAVGHLVFATAGNSLLAVPFDVRDRFNKTAPMFSPDGKWLAFSSDESGMAEVYVQALSGSAARHRVSTDGGEEPAWNPNGRELFYRHADQMIAVPVTTTPALAVGAPRVLFEQHFRKTGWAERDYDISPDGTRFLMISEDRPRAELAIVLNWTEELKRLAPTK